MERNWIRNSSDDYRISSNNSRGRLFISVFATKGGDYRREGDYSREGIISNIAH